METLKIKDFLKSFVEKLRWRGLNNFNFRNENISAQIQNRQTEF